MKTVKFRRKLRIVLLHLQFHNHEQLNLNAVVIVKIRTTTIKARKCSNSIIAEIFTKRIGHKDAKRIITVIYVSNEKKKN